MTAAPPSGYPTVPLGGKAPTALREAADNSWVQRIARAVAGLLQGKFNASLAVTLASGAATTTVLDPRLSATSVLYLQPLTAHAAALKYAAPWITVASQQSGQVVFAHANTANPDQTFNLLIIG